MGKRSAASPLLPVHDREDVFQRGVEESEEARLRHARPAMEENQRRIRTAPPADHHPLIDSPDAEIPDLGDAASDELAFTPRNERVRPRRLTLRASRRPSAKSSASPPIRLPRTTERMLPSPLFCGVSVGWVAGLALGAWGPSASSRSPRRSEQSSSRATSTYSRSRASFPS